MDHEQIANVFTYHRPFGDQSERYGAIRDIGKEIAIAINELCPDSAERDQAIARLREAVMWANAAIACNEKEPG